MKVDRLNAAEMVALSKLVSDADAKEASYSLISGEYPISFVVRVNGVIKKGEGYSANVVAKADPWMLLAAALSHLNGVTVDSIVREALTADPELVDSLKKIAAEAIQAIKAATKTPCTGKVTTDLVAERV